MSLYTEFEPVILAGGFGSRLSTLVEDPQIPKPLLPICNRPLLAYQLDLLEKSGFLSATVLTRASTSEPVRTYIGEEYNGKLRVKVEAQDDLLGTAQALLNIKNKHRTGSQYMVISGDLIVDPAFIHAMIDLHVSRDATMTVALKQKSVDPNSSHRTVRSGEIIGTEPSSNQLLFMASSDDYVGTPLKVKHSLLDQFHAIKFGYNILDAHFYLFSRSAMDILERQKHIHSIKHEFVPFLLRCQYRPKLAKSGTSSKQPPTTANPLSSTSLDFDDPYGNGSLQYETLSQADAELVNARSSAIPEKSGVRCLVHMLEDGQYCNRVNTISSYLEANKDIASGKLFVKPLEPVVRGAFIGNAVPIGARTQISNDSVIGEGSTVGSKCGIASSVIGRHCTIGDNVKITGCVIMDHVTIKEGTKLTNTVVCSNAYINQNATLTDTTVGPTYSVEANANHDRDTLSTQTTHL